MSNNQPKYLLGVVLTICTLWNGSGHGNCAYSSLISTRLADGNPINGTGFAANLNGSASYGTAVGLSGPPSNPVLVPCNGVLASNTTFILATQCGLFSPANTPVTFYIGSIYYKGNTLPPYLFNGTTVTGNSRQVNGDVVIYTTTPITPDSQAVAPKVNPSGSPPPGTNATCVAYGFGNGQNTSTVYQLNSRPAVVIDYDDCRGNYSGLPATPTGEVFCAQIYDNGGNQSVCGVDVNVAVLCEQWIAPNTTKWIDPEDLEVDYYGRNGPVESPSDGSLMRMCYFSAHNPICQAICAYSQQYWSFCGDGEEEFTTKPPPPLPPPPQWFLAGIGITQGSGCNTTGRPNLFAYIHQF